MIESEDFMTDGLNKINETWHLYLWVPERFQRIFKTRHIRLTLRTKNAAKAAKLRDEYISDLEAIYDRLDANIRRPTLTDREIDAYVARFRPSRVRRAEPVTVGNLASRFHDAKLPRWTEKTKQEAMSSVNLACDHFGEQRPILDIDRDDCESFKKMVDGLKKHNGLNIDVTTKNKHLSRLHGLLQLAVDSGLIPYNPAENLRFAVPKRQREEKRRKIFEPAELQLMVDKVLERPGADNYLPSMYWVPLISMYSGMRLNEICQLYSADVQKVGGVWCFFISDDRPDKRVKNASSVRYVPVHSELVRLGLLRYVDGLKTERLFPELSAWRDGYGHSFKRFMPSLRRHVTVDPLKVFHSLRHQVATMLGIAGYSPVEIADVLGQERPGAIESSKTYMKKTLVSRMKVLIESIHYELLEVPVFA